MLFQNEVGISGLDGCNGVWDHLNQHLTVSKVVFAALEDFNSIRVKEFSFTRQACNPVYWITHFQCLCFIKELQV